MKELKDRIDREGKTIGSRIVKVDGFINHKIDVGFMGRMGEEFYARFQGVDVNKILTVEASGIAIACMTAPHFGYPPVVFGKKAKPDTMVDDFFVSEAKSFTKGTVSQIVVSKEFIAPGDRVLIVDDFLAHGQAALALCRIVEMAGAEVVGIGIIIDKEFQGGGKLLTDAGYWVEPLVTISEIKDGKVVYANRRT